MGAASMAVVLRGYHRRPVVLLLSLLLSLSCFTDLGCTAQKLIQEEADALREIGSKLNKQWDFTVDPCSGNQGWMEPADKKNNFANNVTCACNATSNTCHVISILLKGQNLTGVLPDEFANLTFLTILDLTRNYLNGTIPTKWASLPLTELSLGGNRIYGSIPKELGQIQTLQSISLEANLLQGSIPEALGNLSNLTRLLISSNNLTGELPESLGKLKNLEDLRIDGNPISGKIPSFVGNWINLNRLDMQGTSMEGPFPTTFSTIESITELRVSDWKGGDGKFPSLERMTHMKELVLRNLSISGTIPNYIGMMSKLRVLDLSYNNLTGEISSNLDGLVDSIDMLYLTNNKLNGSIPGWILSSKKNMDLSFNSFTGSAPSSCQIGNVNLVSSFSSTSDNSIAFCLRKSLPCSEKAKNYQLFINCGGNEATVGENKYQADSVQLGTSAYQESRTWAYSSTGDFVGNEEAAYIATNTSLLNMTNPELYMNARLSPLSLKYFGLCLQKGYYTVALHFAEIMFTDDQTYCSVGRRYFDVSIQGEKVLHDFNVAKEANGTGKVLIKKFTTFVDDTLEIHFQWTGKGTNSIPYRAVYGPLISAISVTPNFKPNRGGSKLSIGAIIGIVVAASVLLVLPFFIWYLFIRKDPRNNDSSGIELQTGSFALKQIKAATKNFDPQNKIGERGFGPVYKGVLPDGSAIAVKQLSSKSKQGNREFINEIGMISTLKHPNLVKLYGCCVQGDHLMLIYEYMENGSLARALFGPQKNHLYLDWQTRIQICIGIARGLTYLHEESMLKIIHRDIKATNILLDKDFNPKICDFSLARLEEEENTHVNTRVAGTVGYMAPEYATRGYLTDKVDVYSFGVVTLEIVSGKSNTNYRPNEQFVYLLDWAYVLQEKRNLLELVDERLGMNYSKEEALEVLELALACTNPSPTLRPKMSSVLDKLEAMAVNQQASSKEHHVRFKAFKKQSRDTQSSTEKSWIDSSESGSGVKNSHASISRPLLDT